LNLAKIAKLDSTNCFFLTPERLLRIALFFDFAFAITYQIFFYQPFSLKYEHKRYQVLS
jgi:hypothetical protein